MMTLEADIDDFRAIGHGVIGLVNVAILLAILAVILSSQSQAPAVIKAGFGLITWLVAQVVRPVTGGTSPALTAQLAPAYGNG